MSFPYWGFYAQPVQKFSSLITEQNIWNGYYELVGDAIFFHNIHLLSKPRANGEGQNIKTIERIKKVSPIAWQHVNLGWRFKL